MIQTTIHFKHWKSDVLSGIIVGLVSIPISMGYAQIAGLPPVYGLYGSLLPILFFGLLTSSPQFVVGVDAMPAVIVGNAITAMGLTLGSPDAVSIVPVFSLLTCLWFLVFWVLRAGRVVKYISTPVMGGFISGIGATIILMQIPKLFGGSPGTGELPTLVIHIAGQLSHFHWLSALLGFGTVLVILAGKKIAPKFPMPVFMMILGVILTAVFHIDQYGVKLLPQVSAGLPKLILPNIRLLKENTSELVVQSLMIALVVMAQTLLASNNYALKYQYSLDTRRELLAYSAAELASTLVGCCPVNGSVSRAGIADQFGCKSQLMSITASLVMLLVLLFGTGLLQLLPVPILTGIVVAALVGILEIKLAGRLWRTNRREFGIFMTAFAGVLFFGTVYGVMIGVALSFFSVVVRAVVPPTEFLGIIPGHEDYYDLRRNRSARAIQNTVLYRFNGNLFFANIGRFEDDIRSAVRPDTRQVIVDAAGIGNIDLTAADRLVELECSLRQNGVRLYLTGHVGSLNDQLRTLGAGCLIENGSIRKTVSLALRDCGLEAPYALEGSAFSASSSARDESESYAEFEWLYGDDADAHLDSLAREIAALLAADPSLSLPDAESQSSWGRVGLFDEDMLLDYVELNLEEMTQEGTLTATALDTLEDQVESQRPHTDESMADITAQTQSYMREHDSLLRRRMAERHPRTFERAAQHRRQLQEHRKGRREPD